MHKPFGLCGPDNKLAPQHSSYHMTGWVIVRNRKSLSNERAVPPSFTLTLYQPPPPSPLLPSFAALCSPPPTPRWRRPHSFYPETRLRGDGEGLSTQSPPSSSPPLEKKAWENERGCRGLSCYSVSSKVEQLAWWRTGRFAVKVLDRDGVERRDQSSERRVRGSFTVMNRACSIWY